MRALSGGFSLDLHWGAVAQRDDTFGHHLLTFLEAAQDFHPAVVLHSGVDLGEIAGKIFPEGEVSIQEKLRAIKNYYVENGFSKD